MSRKPTEIDRAAGGFEDMLAAARRKGGRVRRTTVEKGECLLRQGDPPRGLFVLHSGLGRVFSTAANGREILHAFVGPGEVLGEIEYFAAQPFGSTVEAARRTEAWFIPAAQVDALLATEPRLAIALATTMARRYYRDVERSSARISYPVAHNVLQICLAHAAERGDPCIRLRKQDLAEHVGTSGRHLNRVLKQLAIRGAIEVAPGEVRTVNADVARRLVAER
ncbi:MAG TPA: Crp/Fnr family transcriptional regulator [Kofleriaceae bacterium]|nr:Crp/Fnr family transcriptional regulator [Kofleriaceae bacterium]